MVRPGATEFDDQHRIKGSLDMPLSERGLKQVTLLTEELAEVKIKTIFTAPDESARQTAELLAEGRDSKIKIIEAFRNVDHGLWHGKLIDEVRRNHPRVYKQGIDTPDDVCPPEGEPIHQARQRVAKAVKKCLRKGGDGVIAMIVPDPLAAVIDSMISGEEMHDLWASETDNASWNLIETE